MSQPDESSSAEPAARAEPGGGEAGSGPGRIGRFRVVRRLGAGAFATVWLAHDPEFDVEVAIKVLAENWSVDEAIHDRFVSEARYLRQIRDRRVVHVSEIGALADGRPYFVMDYLDAGSLDDLRRTGVDPAEALRLCAEAARGLDVLHRHHLVHRDVTPGNLLLTRRPDQGLAVVVADLGVARSVVDSSIGAMVVGTPSYMAPEQATGGEVDARADVYALCAVAYALLTGRPPFPVQRMVDLTSRPPDLAPAPIAQSVGAPATLDGLFRSGLASDPHRRPPSAEVLADAFDQMAADLAGGAGGADYTGPAGSTAASDGRVVPVPAPPAEVARPKADAEREGHSAGFYIAMTVLAVLVFTLFVAVVVGLSL